jgi:hypothetical protein
LADERPTGLYLKLNTIMEEVDRIAKRGENKAQGYNYLMAEDIIDDVRQELVKQKVLVIGACTNVNVIDGVTKNGGATYLTTASMEYTIIDCETGERLTFQWAGQGQDSGDKGIYKSHTGSHKTFLRNMLMIPVGDDPEKDNHERAPKGAQKPNPPPPPKNEPPADPIKKETVTAVLAERTKRDGAWASIFPVLSAKGMSSLDGKTPAEQKSAVLEAMNKLSETEAQELLTKLRALPAKQPKGTDEGGTK